MPTNRKQPVTSLDTRELPSRNARHSPCLVPHRIPPISAKPYKCLAALILFCLFSAVPAIAADTDYWAPWVTALTTNSATVNWHGADAGLGSVEYATSTYYEEHKSFQNTVASETPGAYQHVPLVGLEPDTAYVYRVKPSDNPDAFSNRTFRTMPVSGPFTFIVISDSHAQEQRFKYVADAIAKYETDVLFILDGGDYAGHDQEAEWTDYFQFAEGMLAKFPIFHTIGNHEYHNHGNPDGPPTDAAQYHSTFDVPKNGALNYSFDCSGIRLVVLNSPDPNNANGDDPHTSLALAKSQAAWLKEQLDNTMAGTFTIHHHPIWDCFSTTINPHLQPWETLYHAYNISANFAGHTHNYQRYSVKGIPYFVVGNAGGAFADIPEGHLAKWYQYGETRQLGYLKVTVDPENNTATAQEIFVAFVLTDTDETATVYDPPIIADTVTFPLSSTLSTLTV
ncbi:MAG: metallophosphoesterase family protein, partial [Lentisphaerota bacterium]